MSATKLQRATFRTSRLLDFASEKELIAQTGHRCDAWPLVVLKELVDNGLDACEEASIPPKIDVAVDESGITVRDNGPGIPPETVEGVLDFSVRVSSREAYVSPTRGAQGNALKTLVAMPFVLSGEKGRVEISARGVRHEIVLEVDRIRQEPRVSHESHEDGLVRNGTSVRIPWPDSASPLLLEAKGQFLQMVSSCAWLNPHLTISVRWFEEQHCHVATSPGWKKWLPSQPTCAHWYRAQNLERLIAAYVAHDAERGRDRTVRELLGEFSGLTGTAKQKAVLESTALTRTNLSDLVQGGSFDTRVIVGLLESMKSNTRAVKPQALGVIGRDHLEQRCQEAGCEMDSFTYKKVLEEKGGLPQVTESAFAWLGERSSADRRLITGVNWSPGIVNPFRELGKHGRSLDGVLEQQRAGNSEPVILLLHVACPRVEYTDRGKSAVVAEEELEEEIETESEEER